MRVRIAARHCEVPDSARSRAETQVGKLTKFEPRLSAAEVTFEVEKHLKIVEAVLTIDREEPVVAKGEGPEFRQAVDLMTDRLAKILKRRRSLKTDRKGPSVAKTPPPTE